jgi:alcohol dehydrogenase class IV
VLPHVLRFNCVTAAKAYEDLAVHAFPDLRRFSGQERAAAFCSALADLSRACGLPQTLRDMNIPQDWLPRLAKDAMNQTRLLGNNPRPVTELDALAIYQAAY